MRESWSIRGEIIDQWQVGLSLLRNTHVEIAQVAAGDDQTRHEVLTDVIKERRLQRTRRPGYEVWRSQEEHKRVIENRKGEDPKYKILYEATTSAVRTHENGRERAMAYRRWDPRALMPKPASTDSVLYGLRADVARRIAASQQMRG